MQIHSRRDRRRNVRLSIALAAATAFTCLDGRGSEGENPGEEILSLQASRVRQDVVFAVQLQRPADMATMTIEKPRWTARRLDLWPRLAELRSRPVWRVPCYLETEPESGWHAVTRLDRLTFVGRCPAASTVELTFRYPLADGRWREVPLRLDLTEAEEAVGAPSIIERWAFAQSRWFELLARQTGDVGGFCTYAAQRTRRQHELPDLAPTSARSGPRPDTEERMYAVTTGALAVQESLQLDRMTQTDRDSAAATIPIANLPAISVASHPFDRMRGDRQPLHSDLARLVPETNYYVRFGSVEKLLEILDFGGEWGPSLLRLVSPVGTNYRTRQRTHEQLCLPDNVLTRLLGPAVVEEVVLSGSDPYLRDGSDIAAIFAVRNRDAFQAAVDVPFRQARALLPESAYEETAYRGVTIERLAASRRDVSCYRCWLDQVCVYSNSPAAIRRIIDVHEGRLASLADAADFRYMRAVIFPLDPEPEDGFVYLSDAFIRRVVGPELRIKQKRRLEAVTSLKLLTNAVLLYGYRHGPSRPTMTDLVNDRTLYADDLYDPEGGTISWDAEHAIARSSVYGDLSFLTPLVEIDTTMVTERERDEYARFRERYQQYWRTYFDPIAVRIKVDRTIRLETFILPLIDSSTYDRFEDTAGGEPVDVHLGQFTPDTLLRFVMKLDQGTARAQALGLIGGLTNATTDWVGEWLTFWVEDTDAFTDVVRYAYESADADDATRRQREQQHVIDVFNASFVLGVHVTNKVSLAAFLVALRSFTQTTAPNTVVFNNLEPYQGITIVQIAPDPAGEIAQELGLKRNGPQDEATTRPAVREQAPALYYASIGDGLYVSTQASALRGLIDRLKGMDASARARGDSISANILLHVAPGAAELARPAVDYLLEQRARRVSLGNLAQVQLLGRCGVLEHDQPLRSVSRSYLGYELTCPNGGTYRYDPEREEAFSTVYGPVSSPKRLDAMPGDSPLGQLLDSLTTLTAYLRFTDEGLATTVAIERR